MSLFHFVAPDSVVKLVAACFLLSGARWASADVLSCTRSSCKLCSGALGGEGNVALCLESQMGLRASQHASSPSPKHDPPPARLPCPPPVSRWPVRTTRPPGLQQRLLFLAR